MNEARKCARCGAAVPSGGGVQGICPRCLMELAAHAPEPEAFRPGAAPSIEELAAVFPRLEVLRQIGQGGMGAVFEARQPELDRRIALKVLPAALARDPAFAERFEREARTLARLDHSNIVRVHDAGRAGEWFYLAMEYVDGVDLRQMMRAGECTPRQALAIVAQLCDALQYAHDHGVVHRDIKPENVLVDRRGGVKVADFGLAKLVGRAEGSFQLTRSDQAMGTLHYMAPEQVERPLIVDHRADIYSLGVVMYELLTGELPIGHFPRPSQSAGVDARLDDVVLKTLEKEPNRRFQQASEVKTAVGLAHRPDFATPAAAEEPEEPRRARWFGGRGARSEQGSNSCLSWALGCGCLLILFTFAGILLFGARSFESGSAVREQEAANAARVAELAKAAHAEAASAARLEAIVGIPFELDEQDGHPRLTLAAIRALELDETSRLDVEARLAFARERYLELEATHAASLVVPDESVVWMIDPFPEERAALLDALARDLQESLGAQKAAQFITLAAAPGWALIAPYGETTCELRLDLAPDRVHLSEAVERDGSTILSSHLFVPPLPHRFRRFAP